MWTVLLICTIKGRMLVTEPSKTPGCWKWVMGHSSCLRMFLSPQTVSRNPMVNMFHKLYDLNTKLHKNGTTNNAMNYNELSINNNKCTSFWVWYKRCHTSAEIFWSMQFMTGERKTPKSSKMLFINVLPRKFGEYGKYNNTLGALLVCQCLVFEGTYAAPKDQAYALTCECQTDRWWKSHP